MSSLARVILAASGLLALTGVNVVAAVTLDSGNPRPVLRGVEDIINNESWAGVSYQAYTWWLSTQFTEVTVKNVGSSSTAERILLDSLRLNIPQVHLDTSYGPIDLTGISQESGTFLLSHRKLSDGHKIHCTTLAPKTGALCDFFIVWDSTIPETRHVHFVAANLGQTGFVLIEESLLDRVELLGLSQWHTDDGDFGD